MRPRWYQPPAATASGGIVSAARRAGQLVEYRKHQGLAIEVVGLGLAHRAVYVGPDLGDTRQPCAVLRSVSETGAEPRVDGIDEGRERFGLGAGDLVAERMQRARIERGQAIEQADH